MRQARGGGSEIVSHCGLKLWELRAIQIIGFLKIGSGVRDRQQWDRERCAPKGSVQPTHLQACSPVAGAMPRPENRRDRSVSRQAKFHRKRATNCAGRSARPIGTGARIAAQGRNLLRARGLGYACQPRLFQFMVNALRRSIRPADHGKPTQGTRSLIYCWTDQDGPRDRSTEQDTRGRKVTKGVWWMPWLSEAMKDAIGCDKPWGGA